jgi:nucleotide-binding universal stress UspA family protein
MTMKVERVLVPLDGSPVAEAILPFIEQIAGPLDLEIVLLRVVPLTPVDVVTMARELPPGEETEKELSAERYLEPLVETLRARGIRVGARVRIGSPATEIVAAAQEVGADLIAMTTHGRSGLGRLLFGSVAEAVLRAAPIPVFLLRMTEEALGRMEGPIHAA